MPPASLGVLEEYEPICAETSALYSGATEVIETLKAEGKQVGLVTNKPRRFVELMLPAFGLQDAFDSIVAGDDLPTKKPEPDMVHKALAIWAELRTKPVSLVIAKQTWGQPRRQGHLNLVSFGYAGDLNVYHCGANRVIQNLMELIVNDT